MKTHDQFFLAQRAHNLLTPLINGAEQDSIKMYMSVQVNTGAEFASAINLHVNEILPDGTLNTLAYHYFDHNESLKDWMDQLDGVVEHVRDTLVIRRGLKELAA